MTAGRPRVRIVVEELVLRGLTPGQAASVVTGLERTLGVLAAGADPAGLTGGALPVARPRTSRTPAPSAAALGAQAARAVWAAVGGVR
ncbi:hypothetical protein [Streptomyces zaomyceticus]|uniref:hypothetical protein n=1 Tax=Streptomyces zaomyceticus TaxID=68286 RepID=UPI0016761630|nr:hypothetical protein [Streptomyces zaomyceticus]GHG00569.1 hypothetical protein GCM10018791_09930 [Streptomyces zaomyceticus]